MRARFVFAPSIAMVAAITALGVGCGEVERSGQAGEPSNSKDAPARAVKDRRRASRRRLPRCPASAVNCRRAGGRVLYVERVDPDGDGDAHLVLASRQSITAPGLTIVDVRPRLRPVPLPRPGDWVGAAGPVFPGSRGQSQIEARKVRVRRLRR